MDHFSSRIDLHGGDWIDMNGVSFDQIKSDRRIHPGIRNDTTMPDATPLMTTIHLPAARCTQGRKSDQPYR